MKDMAMLIENQASPSIVASKFTISQEALPRDERNNIIDNESVVYSNYLPPHGQWENST
jgi:hypothetical protein